MFCEGVAFVFYSRFVHGRIPETVVRLYCSLIIPVILLCIYGFVNKAKDEVHIVIFLQVGQAW